MKERHSELEKTKFKKQLKDLMVDLAFLVVGCSVSSFATTAVLIPNGLAGGGITGMSRILERLTSINFSLIYYLVAFIIFIACLLFLGKKEAKKIAVMTILYPTVQLIFSNLNLSLLEQKDMTLGSVFCGLLYGIGSGLIFTRGYSSGGTDTIAKMIQKRLLPQMPMSKILLGVDATIIIMSGFVFGTNIALYALISSIIFSKVSEMVLYGFDPKSVQLGIISNKSDEIAQYILHEIDRGVTYEEVVGAYTEEKRNKLITICSPRESMLIRKFIASVDKKAFVSVMHVDMVWGAGRGFSDIEIK